ncbi:MAG: DNA cytosine methyltransferase, partial [Cetobacterium sp.]
MKIFECFAGYGSQHMASKKVWNNVESVGICEVDSDVIISNGAIHYPEQFEAMIAQERTPEQLSNAREWLRKKNIGFDFAKGKSKLDRMPKDKLMKLAVASMLTKNYGDISLTNTSKLDARIDLFTWSFPCQSFSNAGKR